MELLFLLAIGFIAYKGYKQNAPPQATAPSPSGATTPIAGAGAAPGEPGFSIRPVQVIRWPDSGGIHRNVRLVKRIPTRP